MTDVVCDKSSIINPDQRSLRQNNCHFTVYLLTHGYVKSGVTLCKYL